LSAVTSARIFGIVWGSLDAPRGCDARAELTTMNLVLEPRRDRPKGETLICGAVAGKRRLKGRKDT
jgi:hypothetical protein